MIVEFILILYIQKSETVSFERFVNKTECMRIGKASKELNKDVKFFCEPVLGLIKK